MLRLYAKILLIGLLLSPATLWASKRILVDLTHQIAIAYQDGKVKFYGRISSGKPGRETPTGSFYVREKDIDHVSNLWPKPNGGAHMPYALRITHDGIAMHLGPTPNYPASHGCIRMRSGFAQRMYAWAQKYTKVDIIGHAPAHSPSVVLPAYTRSKTFLQRSLGGGTGDPLNILSANPKAHSVLTPNTTTSRHRKKRAKRIQITHRSDHGRPLAILSGRFHIAHSPSARTHQTHSKSSHRRHTRIKRKNHNRHPRPFHVFSAH